MNKTKEELQKELNKIYEDEKTAKEQELVDKKLRTFERCKDYEYIINYSEYPLWVVMRRVSNIRMGDFDKCAICDLHEEIRITYRVNDDRFSDNSTERDISINYSVFPDGNGYRDNFVQHDYPSTREDFEKAKEFALYQENQMNAFISSNPFLTNNPSNNGK